MQTGDAVNQRGEQKFVASLTVLLLLTINLAAGIHLGMEHFLAGSRHRHIQYIATAISDLVYDIDGYVYSNLVYSTLTDRGMGEPEDTSEAGLIRHFTNEPSLKSAMAAAASLSLDAVRSSPTTIIGLDDLGYVEFLKVSYRVFGVKYSAAYYGYFLLLGASVVTFLLFPPLARTYSVAILLVFLAAHLALLQVVPDLSYEFLSVTNVRFFNALAILPLIHLVCAVLSGIRWRSWDSIGAALQSFLLAFTLVVRSSGIWLVMFLALVLVCALAYPRLPARGRPLAFHAKTGTGVLILGVVLLIWAGLNANVNLQMSPRYEQEGGVRAHFFWHNGFNSLLAHPQLSKILMERYHASGDQLPLNAAMAKVQADGRPESEWKSAPGIQWPIAPAVYEQTIRELYLELLRAHPQYMVEKYIYYQPREVLIVLASMWAKGIWDRAFEFIPMLTLFTVIVLWASVQTNARWLVTSMVMVALLAAFAILPSIWGGTGAWLLGEAALLSICLVYVFLILVLISAIRAVAPVWRGLQRRHEGRLLLHRLGTWMPDARKHGSSMALKVLTLGLLAGLVGLQGDLSDRPQAESMARSDHREAGFQDLFGGASTLASVHAKAAAEVQAGMSMVVGPSAPPALVQASSSHSPYQGPDKLFQSDEAQYWHIDASTRRPTEWVLLDLGATRQSSLSYVRMMPRRDVPSQFFTSAILAGSIDGTTWHTLAALTAQSSPVARWLGWKIAPTEPYRFFKLVVPNDIPTQNHTFYSISKMELYR